MTASYDAMRALVSSRLRLNILASLNEPMRLCDLKRAVRSNAPNTSSKARGLQDLGLIKRDNGNYKITPAGRIIHKRLSLLHNTIDAIYSHQEFWEHMLDNLPEELLSSIHEFSNARMIRSNRNDIDKVKKEVLRRIRMAEKELTVVLPLRCDCIVREVEKASKRIGIDMKTLKENPELHYGMVRTNGTTMLFTEMLDMALVKES
jgi:predicted transcriptional regulator